MTWSGHLLCCVVGSQVDCALDVTPVNTAILSGQSAVLHCHTSFGVSAGVSWTRRVVDGEQELVVAACTVLPEFTSVYNLTRASEAAGQCDLVISSVNTSLTGVYTCVELSTQTARAYLTIIGGCRSARCYRRFVDEGSHHHHHHQHRQIFIVSCQTATKYNARMRNIAY